jgi:hypothetical protein
MGLVYTAELDATVTAAGGDTTIWEIDPAADKAVTLLGVSFNVTSEIAEAQEEWLRLKIIRYIGGTFTSANGSAVTPRPQDELNTVAMAAAVEANGTTIASSTGTTHNLEAFGFNVRAGYGPVFYPPEFRHRVYGIANSAMVINMLNTLADDITLTSTLWLEEGI